MTGMLLVVVHVVYVFVCECVFVTTGIMWYVWPASVCVHAIYISSELHL